MLNGMGDWNSPFGNWLNRFDAYLLPYLADALSGKRKKKEQAEQRKKEKE